jgi:hypothetical protein
MSRCSRITKGIVVSMVATVSLLGAALPAGATTAGTGPLADSNVTGNLTFCNRANQPMTSGSLTAVPFVWKAISSSAAPAGYRTSAARATLAAYQPLKYVDPSDWSGGQLTGSTAFTNPLHPVAQSTNGDGPLLSFVQAYPPHFKGLVEVRMLFSGVALPQQIESYPAAVLKVTGNHWTLVSGGGGSCADGTGTSDESVLLDPHQLKHRRVVVAGSHTTSPNGSKNGGGGTGQGHAHATTSPVATQSSAAAATSGDSTGMSNGAKAAIGLGALALIGAAAAAFGMRRRRGEPS